MKKQLLIILLISITSTSLQAQSNYYRKDSVVAMGIDLIYDNELTNAKLCQKRKGDNIIQYTPDEVSEYGFSDGSVFVSCNIQDDNSTKKGFLERLVNGKITLYYYRGKTKTCFFIKKESSPLHELRKPTDETTAADFYAQLSNVTSDCEQVRAIAPKTRYSKSSLSKLITAYNTYFRPKPETIQGLSFYDVIIKIKKTRLDYGVTVGYSTVKLLDENTDYAKYLTKLNLRYEGGLTVGCFIDKALFSDNLSIRAELYYSKQGFSYHNRDFSDLDFIGNLESINLPMLLRYSYSVNKFRPFISIGGIYTRNIRNNNSLYLSNASFDGIEINILEENNLLPKKQFGYSLGTGVAYKFNKKIALLFEVRYNKQKALADKKALNVSGFHFITGINF